MLISFGLPRLVSAGFALRGRDPLLIRLDWIAAGFLQSNAPRSEFYPRACACADLRMRVGYFQCYHGTPVMYNSVLIIAPRVCTLVLFVIHQ